jgi:uncharacterized membrane protein
VPGSGHVVQEPVEPGDGHRAARAVATVLVAFVDAIGIGLGLVILGVPLAFPLIAFVFLASFIPIIGALLSGVVAVLVALVTVGLVKASRSVCPPGPVGGAVGL